MVDTVYIVRQTDVGDRTETVVGVYETEDAAREKYNQIRGGRVTKHQLKQSVVA